MKTLAIAVAGATAITLLTTSTTLAQESSWQSRNLSDSDAEQLYAPASDNMALAFVCAGGKLMSAISMETNDASDIMEAHTKTRRRLKKQVALSLDGEEVNSSDWIINPTQNIYLPKEYKVTAKLYNAVIKGQKVSFQRKGKESYTLTLPQPNQAFNEFGAACGIGTKKEAET